MYSRRHHALENQGIELAPALDDHLAGLGLGQDQVEAVRLHLPHVSHWG
jgi:hypothetical protein